MTRISRSKSLRVGAAALALLVAGATGSWRLLAQAPEPAKGVKYAQISPADLKEWLTYIASDELQGRQVFTEGYGLAAAYVADHLKEWGIKPLGDDGTYFENVKLKGYRVTRNSSVTIEAGDAAAKTFKHGDHVTFPFNSGGKQTVAFSGVEFVGYGQETDLAGRSLKDKLVVVVPNLSPQGAGGAGGRGGRGGRGGGPSAAALNAGAKAVVQFAPTPAPPTAAEQALTQAQDALDKATQAIQQAQAQMAGRGGAGRGGFGAGGGRGRGALPPADLTTVQRVDGMVPPQFSGDETFFEALFGAGPVKFADVLAKAQKGEPIPPMALAARVTVNIDNTFDVVSEQLTRNVVGILEGSDPKLKDTYVMIGAHLDHIGYSQTGGGNPPSPSGCRRRGPEALAALAAAGKTPQNPANLGRGRGAAGGAGAPGAPAAGGGAGGGGRGAAPAANPVPFDQRDFISNGADDDGSGTVSELGVAKAFATGPRPKRSIVFVWHTGEEAGLYGSRYNADFPVVPLDKVQAQLNMDMVGRDDCDNLEGDYTNSVFIVGADRISTDLHNLIVETNGTMTKPLGLDYELNDPNDPESVYTRSDHYSYAAKGIPIAFFTTGLHKDYHRVTDTVDKITFPKMARIAQLLYETGFSIANTDRVLVRDNKGPRTGFGSKAEVIKK
ncbi:MAG TPA: M28 family peptidase [Vicinamibacterales bacterium]|nr:M28 family peptidase [Vicinamibacterales bacterium]